MKLNWNFLGGGGCKTKTFRGGSMDIFWNCTLIIEHHSCLIHFGVPLQKNLNELLLLGTQTWLLQPLSYESQRTE